METRASAEAVIAAARSGEPDRYLAALLAPRSARDGLLALAAFAAELGRIGPRVTREPAMGDIRLQWWRDVLELSGREASGHPVADALCAASTRHGLPMRLLLRMIDARASDLEAEPFATEDIFQAYLVGSEGSHFTLAALVLGSEPGPALVAACAASGRCYGLVRVLLCLPRLLSQGRLPLPLSRLHRVGLDAAQLTAPAEDNPAQIAALLGSLQEDIRITLADARTHVANLPRRERLAFLPLALVDAYLRALRRPGRDPLREVADILPLQRTWSLLRARWTGRP